MHKIQSIIIVAILFVMGATIMPMIPNEVMADHLSSHNNGNSHISTVTNPTSSLPLSEPLDSGQN